MKKYMALVVCLAFVLLYATSAFATKIYYEDGFLVEDTSMDPADDSAPYLAPGESWKDPNMKPISKSIDVYVNGMPLFPDVDPYLDVNDRTMIPIRFISEALNSTVNWDAKDSQGRVDIKRKGKELKLWINKKQASIDGTTLDMDTVPVLKNNRTMVPARFVAQAFGAEVLWNQGDQRVVITLND